MRALVADDRDDVRLALELLLKRAGHQGEGVASPREVQEALSRSRYDVVLLDLNYTRDTTSGREGLDLILDLQRQRPELPVVAMTAWGSVELAVEAMREGARDFVLKPWDDEKLLRTLERHGRPGRAALDLDRAGRVQARFRARELPASGPLEVAGACVEAGAVGGDVYDVLELGARPRRAARRRRGRQGRLRSPPDRVPAVRDPQPERPGAGRPPGPRGLRQPRLPRLHGARALRDAVPRRLRRGGRPAALRQRRAPGPAAAPAGRARRAAAADGLRAGAVRGRSVPRRGGAARAGDLLLAFTDGMVEARRGDEEFGDDRLSTALAAHAGRPLEEIAAALVSEVSAFAAAEELDDRAVLLARVREAEA